MGGLEMGMLVRLFLVLVVAVVEGLGGTAAHTGILLLEALGVHLR